MQNDLIPHWQRPDWREIEHYPCAESVSHKQLAWEFLRRNDDYNRTYSEFCAANHAAQEVLSKDCLRQFGLATPMNPAADYSPEVAEKLFHFVHRPCLTFEDFQEFPWLKGIEPYPGQAMVFIDLTIGIKDQLTRIENWVKDFQPWIEDEYGKVPNVRKHVLVKYLRTLDSEAARDSDRTITREVQTAALGYATSSDFREGLRQARTHSSAGWRRLAYLDANKTARQEGV